MSQMILYTQPAIAKVLVGQSIHAYEQKDHIEGMQAWVRNSAWLLSFIFSVCPRLEVVCLRS